MVIIVMVAEKPGGLQEKPELTQPIATSPAATALVEFAYSLDISIVSIIIC